MAPDAAIETALVRAFDTVTGPSTPSRLRAAMHHALFPGGARVRPRLAVRVADASGGEDPSAAEAAAVALEFLHCASLVHDDLPCFDNAAVRRGRPSVHAEFGEELAVLAGDGLIIAAYEVLGRSIKDAEKLGPMISIVSAGVGSVRGIVAGQAWESESHPDVRLYHRAKTGALFEAAVCAGALAGGGDAAAWRALGGLFGEAYQVADDILDLVGSSRALGKPVGQDAMLGRPSAALELGLDGAHGRLTRLMEDLVDAVPACSGRSEFRRWLSELCARIFPAKTNVVAGPRKADAVELNEASLSA